MHLLTAKALTKLNRVQEALEYLDLAIQKNPENSEYYYSKGKNLYYKLKSNYFSQNEQI